MYTSQRTIRVDSYDFFGYLAPGLIVYLSSCILLIRFRDLTTLELALNTLMDGLATLTPIQGIFIAITSIFFSYVIGHFCASFSAMIFEKVIVGKIFNYPFKSIIFNEGAKHDYSGNYYRALVSTFFLTIFFYLNGSRTPWYIADKKIPFCSIFGLIFFSLIILKLCYSPMLKANLSFHPLYKIITNNIFKVFGFLFLTVEKLSSNFSGQIKTFPDSVRADLTQKYRTVFGTELDKELTTEIFWSIYWYVTTQNEYIRSKTDKWLILYGFMRNISFSLIVAAVLTSIPCSFSIPEDGLSRIVSYSELFLAIIFSFRYYYIYFGYYSKTIFRAFVYLPHPKAIEAVNP